MNGSEAANILSDGIKPFFLENISKFCDKCGTAYNVNDIGIISETNSSAIIQAQCHKCKASYMAQIVKPLQLTKKVPIKLDISPMLIKPFYDKGPITADEVLEIRKKIMKSTDIAELTNVPTESKQRKPRKFSKRIQKATKEA